MGKVVHPWFHQSRKYNGQELPNLKRPFCELHWEEIMTKVLPLCESTEFFIFPPWNNSTDFAYQNLRLFQSVQVPCIGGATRESFDPSDIRHSWFRPQSINQSVNQSTNQSISRSISQSVEQSVCQSTNQSISQPISQLVNQSVNQSSNQSTNQSTNQQQPIKMN